ncbi:MAG: T9SS type A sorting domain-containing protein [Saprospirales bacterium]|nr:T9SS type A sorting domain-containing protein [Saprospirales bacterium]MBK8490539.1 T9SS type A sorting domain-containing protein [Saprospirales bacterium]
MPTHTYGEAGEYTVILTATNECGSKTQEITLLISSAKDQGIVDQLRIFPNPNEGRFTVQIVASRAGNEPVQLRLVNALGQVLMQQEYFLLNGALVIPVEQEGLAAGFYWLEIQLGDQKVGKKIAVE